MISTPGKEVEIKGVGVFPLLGIEMKSASSAVVVYLKNGHPTLGKFPALSLTIH